MEQKIKTYTGGALIILLLVASYGIFQYVASYSRGVQVTRIFTVSGSGKVVGIPNVAQFSFSVITEGGKNIVSLQADNTKKGNAIIDFVKSKEVDAKDIQTQNYSLNPRYQKLDIVGYTVSQNVLVKVRNFATIGDILSGVVTQGANSVSQLSFSIDDPTSLQNQARAKAIEKAKEDALALAKAGKFGLGRLISISEGYSYPQPLYFGFSQSSKDMASPTIEPGSQEISSTVTLTYEIK